MDKRMIKLTVAMMALLLGWMWFTQYLAKRNNWWLPGEKQQWEQRQAAERAATERAAATQAAAATQEAATQTASTQGVPGVPATQQAGPAPVASAPAISAGRYRYEGGTGMSVQLGSTAKDSPYVLGVSIRPQGAALESVTLNRFLKDARSKEPYIFQQPYNDNSPLDPALATRAAIVNGTSVDLSGANWALEPGAGENAATYSLAIVESATNAPVLRIRKAYTIATAKDVKKPNGEAYEVAVVYTLENVGSQPLTAKLVFNGTNAPHAENRNDMVYVAAGFDHQQNVVSTKFLITELSDKEKEKEIKHEKNFPLLWAGTTSAYFDSLVRGELPNNTLPLASAKAIALNPSAEPVQRHVAIEFQTADATLAPGAQARLPLSVFLGPKLRDILQTEAFSTHPRGYDQILVFTSGPCAWCTFDWLINGLVGMLRFFHNYLVFDWGLAIILLVCIVRGLLHPITKRSQISMSKFAKIGPEMERLKKKYADDPDELKRLQAELIREQGMTPIFGCLPMFLQMPIWIALWQSLQTTFELRHASFLWGFTWIKDLSQPDHLFVLKNPFHLWFIHVDALNLLPILMAVVFWIQYKMQPKPVAATPEQEQQQKIMQWMSLLFPIMLYTGPSGLNLYILTSTTIGIIESKIIRDHIKQREEAEKAGKVLVDAGSKKKSTKDSPKKEAKRGGLAQWLADLQSKADELRKEQDKNRRKS